MRKKNSTGAFRGSIDRSDVSGGTRQLLLQARQRQRRKPQRKLAIKIPQKKKRPQRIFRSESLQ